MGGGGGGVGRGVWGWMNWKLRREVGGRRGGRVEVEGVVFLFFFFEGVSFLRWEKKSGAVLPPGV